MVNRKAGYATIFALSSNVRLVAGTNWIAFCKRSLTPFPGSGSAVMGDEGTSTSRMLSLDPIPGSWGLVGLCPGSGAEFVVLLVSVS